MLIPLDFFSLGWVDFNYENSRITGLISIDYVGDLDIEIFIKTLNTLVVNYPVIAGRLYKDNNNKFFLNIPDNFSDYDFTQHYNIGDQDFDALVLELANKTINMIEDPNYSVYILPKDGYTTIVFFASHLLGDGISKSTAISILFYNYYQQINNGESYYPPMKFTQLQEYAFKMRFSRYGKLMVPNPFRVIPGLSFLLKTRRRVVPDQEMNVYPTKEDKLLVKTFHFPEDFSTLRKKMKEIYELNSHDLFVSIISYVFMKRNDYESTHVTYPVNLRNNLEFSVGNIITANTVKVEYAENLHSFLVETKKVIDKEKGNLGPYYAITLAKFLKKDLESVHKRISGTVRTTNLRLSNVGSFPTYIVYDKMHDLFPKLPLRNYSAIGLPIGGVGSHFFYSYLENETANSHLITTLCVERVEKVIDEIYSEIENIVLPELSKLVQ